MLSAIPKHLLSIAKQPDTFNKSFFASKDNIFPLNESSSFIHSPNGELGHRLSASRLFYPLQPMLMLPMFLNRSLSASIVLLQVLRGRPLNESAQINFGTARDFYKLLVPKTHAHDQTGPKHWSENLSVNKDSWTSIFMSLKNVCKESRLKEFQFKLIHRIIITRKELFIFGIKTDDKCLYHGDKDSIEHAFIECPFMRSFAKNIT